MDTSTPPAATPTEFLDAVWPDGYLSGTAEIRYKDAQGLVRRMFCTDPGDLIAAAAVLDADVESVWFSPGIRRGPEGTDEAVEWLPAAWCDWDDKCVENTTIQPMETLRSLEQPPSLIVRTGHGWQGYWLFQRYAGRLEKPRVRAVCDAIQAYLSQRSSAPLDSVGNPSRVLRLPGTWNRKDPADPQLCEVVHFEPGRRYTLAELEAVFPVVAQKRSADSILGRISPGQRNTTLARLAGGMRRHGMTGAEINAALLAVNRRCDPPLSDDEVWRIAQGMERYTPADSAFTSVAVDLRELTNTAVPRYPVDALPPLARKLVEEGAAALGCPTEMIAVPMLALVGGVLGNRFAIELKSGFTQYPVLWTAVVAPPGTMKSPALDVARTPLDILQGEAKERYDAEMTAYDAAMAHWAANRAQAKPRKPELPHFYSTDTTIEAISRILSASPGVALVRDEIAGWIASFDAYKAGKGGERQTHLSSWAGAPMKIDRKAQEPIFLPHPVIGVVGGIQPDLLPTLTAEASRRDGFLERFLWSMPETSPATWTEATIDDSTTLALMTALRALRHAARYVMVKPDPNAKAAFVEFYNENATWTDAGLMAGVNAKMPNQVARLALILHCLTEPDQADRPLSAETMRAAIAIGEYHRAHARRVLTLPQLTGGRDADAVIPVVLAALTPDWLDKTALFRATGSHLNVATLDAGLYKLARAGLAESMLVSSGTLGGRPRQMWRRRWVDSPESTQQDTPDDDSLWSTLDGEANPVNMPTEEGVEA